MTRLALENGAKLHKLAVSPDLSPEHGMKRLHLSGKQSRLRNFLAALGIDVMGRKSDFTRALLYNGKYVGTYFNRDEDDHSVVLHYEDIRRD